MCGIVGIARRRGDSLQLSREQQDSALASIRHRGPDSEGQYADERVWLGHLRLKIIDLSDAGSQPMTTPSGRFILCYNGEVYNFAELARELDLQDLRSHSDTEVVLRAFMKMGVASIKLLNGMFAFAIYDREARKIWLVRDRLGIKPLYYRISEQGLFFASEIKGLLALNGHESSCDLSALHEWVYYGTTLGEHTLFQRIQKLLPGHYLELDLDSFRSTVECYWSPTQYAGCEKFSSSVDEQVKQTRELLARAVERQLVSDVPVGVFLSGGIDSSAITAFAARRYGSSLSTYSVGFDFDKGVNELPKAKAIAALYGTQHHELHISGFEISDVVQKMVECHDMPFSDAANIPLYLLSVKINDNAKVILQGDGGDEMFGGYSRYTTLSFSRMAKLAARVGNIVNSMTPRNIHYYRRQRYINALTPNEPAEMMALLLTEEDGRSNPTDIFTREFRSRVMTADRFARYKECQSYFQGEDPVNQMLLVDAMIILPDIFLEKVDRSTMAASVEVRVPFLDNDLVDFCMRLTGPQKVRFGQKKWLLKKALSGVVPDSVLYGKKTGFSVPYGYWLRAALRPLFFDQLEMFDRSQPAVLERSVIEDIYAMHESRRRDHAFLLWKILNFMIWANQTSISLN